MKVGVITLSLRYNYGGILQAYALQQVLKKLGHDPITMKLGRKFPLRPVEFAKYYVGRLIGKNISKPVTKKELAIVCKNTDPFIDKYIKMSPPMYYLDKEWVRNQQFDAFVVGSDQILHPGPNPDIEDIYLSFIDNPRKVVYAGSFGPENCIYSEDKRLLCKEALKHFRGVSVRERDGKKKMKDFFDVDAELVLDPTLLLRPEDYPVRMNSNTSNGNLVTYILDPREGKSSFIDGVAKTYGKQIVKANNESMDDLSLKPQDRVNPSVESWLQNIAMADYVITDSFHGAAFSIIFQKQFVAIANKERGYDRFLTLFDTLGLNANLISDIDAAEVVIPVINYKDVNKRLDALREKCYDFLKCAIER